MVYGLPHLAVTSVMEEADHGSALAVKEPSEDAVLGRSDSEQSFEKAMTIRVVVSCISSLVSLVAWLTGLLLGKTKETDEYIKLFDGTEAILRIWLDE